MFASTREKAAAGVVLLSLALLPAPLLPPHRLAEALQSLLGIRGKAAYLTAAIGLQIMLYVALGTVAAFAVRPPSTRRQRGLQFVFVPLVVVIGAMTIRSVKLGHVPLLANAFVPMFACFFGVGMGLLVRHYGWWTTGFAIGVTLAVLLCLVLPGVSSQLSRNTEATLRRLIAAGPSLPAGEAKFGALLKIAFTPLQRAASQASAIEENRAAILGLGIAIGHERLARFAGVKDQPLLLRDAIALRQGTAIRGREDWARHFCLSAALVVLENPFLSDAGGLLKEELDALARGSGFSFGDLLADRAGVKFASAATDSEAAAKSMQVRLQREFALDEFFPHAADLPENLTLEQFRLEYGGVGDPRYRRKAREIETLLEHCPGLTIQPSGP